MKRMLDRRTVLRGMIGGTAIAIGLPLLEIFLDDHGTALADGGALPVRFGTWFWGCGMNPERWTPTTEGAGYDLPVELAALGGVAEHVSVLSGFGVTWRRISRIDTPSQSLSSRDQVVTQWMSECTRTRGSSRNSAHVHDTSRSTSPKQRNVQVAGSKRGVPP